MAGFTDRNVMKAYLVIGTQVVRENVNGSPPLG